MRHLPGLAFIALAVLPFFMRNAPATPAIDGMDGDVETVVILSPHRRELREEYSRAFPEYMARVHGRAVRVSWRDPGGGTESIMKDLAARHKQDTGPGADLFFGGGVRPHQDAKAAGWLTPVPLPDDLLAAIPETVAGQPVYDADGYWYGVALASFGIIYHGGLVERLGLPPPRAWADLADPAYAGWLASGNPQSSGVVHTCYQTILQAYGFDAGWRMLVQMAANTRVFGEGAAVAPTEVAAGDAAAGMAIENYATTAIRNARDPALAYVSPAGLTLVNADAISMLKGGPNPDLARKFVEFCLSAEGQRLLIQPAGTNGQRVTQRRYPVRADLYAGPDAPADNPYSAKTPFAYDEKLASLRRPVLNDLAGTWLIDTHPQLAAAWRAVLARGGKAEEVAALTAPPLTDAEFLALATRWKAMASDPKTAESASRERVVQRRVWSVAAMERYSRLAAAEKGATKTADGVF